MHDLTTTGKSVVKPLRCDLTDEEKLRKAENLGHKLNEFGRIQTGKKEAASSYKAQEEAAQGEINEAGRALANGYEIRSVECRVLMDFRNSTVAYERIDTNEIVEERRMTMQEKQMRLALD